MYRDVPVLLIKKNNNMTSESQLPCDGSSYFLFNFENTSWFISDVWNETIFDVGSIFAYTYGGGHGVENYAYQLFLQFFSFFDV
jgi:hypothetical protein